MNTSSSLSEAMQGFVDLARKIHTAEAGKDILFIKEECEGYETTPLEQETFVAIDRVREVLGQHPEQLSAPLLTMLLQGIILAAPAVDEYRARYLGAAGDYADIQSPLAFGIKNLLDALRKALETLESAGCFPLTEVEESILLKPIALYQTAFFEQELYKFILSGTMGSKERKPFLTFVRRQGDEVREKIRLLRQAGDPWKKKQAISAMVSAFCDTEADVAEEVGKTLVELIDSSNSELRAEAGHWLGRAGFRVFPFLRERFVTATDEHRGLLLRALCEMGTHCLTGEREVLYFFLNSQPPVNDPRQEALKRDLLKEWEPSELTLAWSMTPGALDEKKTPPASPTCHLEAETLGFYRNSFWVHYTNGDFARYDATIIKILKPANLAGKEIRLCFPVTPPFEHFLRRPGQRFSCETTGIFWQPYRGFLFWPDIEKTVKTIDL